MGALKGELCPRGGSYSFVPFPAWSSTGSSQRKSEKSPIVLPTREKKPSETPQNILFLLTRWPSGEIYQSLTFRGECPLLKASCSSGGAGGVRRKEDLRGIGGVHRLGTQAQQKTDTCHRTLPFPQHLGTRSLRPIYHSSSYLLHHVHLATKIKQQTKRQNAESEEEKQASKPKMEIERRLELSDQKF